MTHSPHRVLVVRRDNIGDLVCTTPLLDALRNALPRAHLAALVNSYNAEVLMRNPALDAVHVYTKLKHRTPGSSALAPLLARIALIRRLRRERFDLAILARSGFDRHGLNFVRLLGIPRVIGFTPTDRPRGITDALPVPDNAQLHEVEAVCQLLRPLGIETAPGPLKVFPDPRRIAAWRKKIGAAATVAVHVSAREATRQLATENWVSFLRGLCAVRPDLRIALFWSPGKADDPRHPGDDTKAQDILQACDGLGVIPCPTATLEDLMAGLACCSAFVGADGGAMHVAVACGLPTVGLFENSPFKLAHWHPWQVRREVVASPTFAISDISPEALVAAYSRLMTPTA
jgi:ADP-heptose:LPS heptosyltransferase